MKKIGGVLLILMGTIVLLGGIYTGIWLCLVGGIVEIIDQIKAKETDSLAIALAIVKIVFFELPIGLGIYLGAGSIGGGMFFVKE